MVRGAAVILSVFVLCSEEGSAQTAALPDSFASYFTFEEAAPFSCLLTYFPPLFIQHGIDLKRFIRSGSFRRLRGRFGDLRAVDAVYIRAMQLTDNNTAVSLLLSALATFDHRTVGLKVPIFRLFFPLSDESEEEFSRRVNNLPTALYADTPPGKSGDRDKLQHFFGSAFLAFVFESRDAAERIGEFVEEGEEAFIIGGVNDERDLRADRQGQDFGLALLADNRRFPSRFIKFVLATAPPDSSRRDSCLSPSTGVR